MYTVKLHDFEGPLDLLLFFIRRDELDIYNIPISRITKEFLDYVHYMEMLDLEVAGEFLVMAAELMQIKAKMLLPPEKGEEEEEDPRANLVQRLVEYKRFKESAQAMTVLEEERMKIHARGTRQFDPIVKDPHEDQDALKDVSLFDLISAFKFAIEQMPKKQVHEISRINVTIDEQIDYILDFFSKRSEATFYDLVQEMRDRVVIVVTFLALLELIRSKRVIVRQQKPFGELSIMRALSET